MSTETFGFLPSAVVQGQDVVVVGLPDGTSAVVARTAFGRTISARVSLGTARLE